MQHLLILIVYAILACLSLIPLGILGAGVCFGPVIVLRVTREARQEARRREEERYTHEQGAKQMLLQPAYKLYVAGRGWYVAGYVARYLFAHAQASSSRWVKQAMIALYVASKNPLFTVPAWLAVIGLHVAARVLYLSAILSALLFLPLYIITLLIWGVLTQVSMIALALLSFIGTYSVLLRCPHCYKEMPIPTYLCPSCEAEHTRLWPSSYGILAHRCIRCKTSLPTLDLFGRGRLSRVCPACRSVLPLGIESGASVHIALIGGTSAGKTSYLMMAVDELQQTYSRYKVNLIDATQEQHVKDYLRRLKRGQTLNPTREIAPHAYTLKIQRPTSGASRLLYLYDPSGEAFDDQIQTSKQAYYQYSDGFIFIIDPLSIPAWSQKQQQASDQQRSGTLRVIQTYERMMTTIELYAGMSERKRYRQPVAVVVSKVDQFQLNNEIGLPAARVRMKYDPSIRSEEEALSGLVRAFLCVQGLENLVRDLELHFAHVGYFSCSALGRTPTANETREFVPDRSLDPLLWILKQRRVL
jgi:hypothetical protein